MLHAHKYCELCRPDLMEHMSSLVEHLNNSTEDLTRTSRNARTGTRLNNGFGTVITARTKNLSQFIRQIIPAAWHRHTVCSNALVIHVEFGIVRVTKHIGHSNNVEEAV